ncbi:MAG: tripartite tricarboxylate transporter TctB family protein [Rhodobacteraceae bacterium]|nr:tripartite tricarboxylate transporter TctB family protein [Paracoccaceae bacterium]
MIDLRTVDGRSLGGQLIELAIWLGLAGLMYSQTGLFDREIPEYLFGATSWPRAICIVIALGAIGQFAHQMLLATGSGTDGGGDRRVRGRTIDFAKRIAIFVFPLIWLFLAPRFGFYLTAPFFVLGMLLLMEVRSPFNLFAVTAVVYALVLLIFTRFFFVALPVGRIQAFYDVNVAIIGIARLGI